MKSRPTLFISSQIVASQPAVVTLRRSQSVFQKVISALPIVLSATFIHSQSAIANEKPIIEQVIVEGSKAELGFNTIEGGKIYTGKKTSIANIEGQPTLAETNLRQMFATLPGLLVSDQKIPSIYNVNYRGLGNPHESEFVAFFQNNIPLASDLFGYPTIYYLPPAQRTERIEFIRGGSGLLYGPQIGPTLNFVTRQANTNADTQLLSEHSHGSFGLYSTYNEAQFSQGDWGFMATYDHRSADGPRDNEDYEVNSGYIGIAYDGLKATRLGFNLNLYQSDSGEAGRLSSAEFATNRNQTLTPFNRIEVERVIASFTYDQQINAQSTLNGNVWYSYQDRFSRRSGQFVHPEDAPATTNIDQQKFDNYGIDLRYAKRWGKAHTLTLGTTHYVGDSPRTRHISDNIRSNTQNPSDLAFEQDRNITYNAVFVENKFTLGNLSIVPSLRHERINYDINEPQKNSRLARENIDVDTTLNKTLLGLGAQYQLNKNSQLYSNISESYRPLRFDDLANPNSELADINKPEISKAINTEMGYRYQEQAGFSLDISAFYIDFTNKIEQQFVENTVSVERINSGDSTHKGIEFAIEYELLKNSTQNLNSLKLFANGSLLDAEITQSLNNNLISNTPAFAPEYLMRTGFIYDNNRLNIALTLTAVDSQFWQDSNQSRGEAADTIAAEIPSYEVIDISSEYKINEQWAIFGGINNLLDNNYYNRVRNDGIEPAAERSLYAGFTWQL